MKKLLATLLVVSGFAYANCDVPANAQTVVNKLHEHNMKTILVKYSSDQISCRDTCKKNVEDIDKTITVTPILVSGTGICKFSKASKS